MQATCVYVCKGVCFVGDRLYTLLYHDIYGMNSLVCWFLHFGLNLVKLVLTQKLLKRFLFVKNGQIYLTLYVCVCSKKDSLVQKKVKLIIVIFDYCTTKKKCSENIKHNMFVEYFFFW